MRGLPEAWQQVKLADVLQTLEVGLRPKGGVGGIFEGIPSLGGEHIASDGGFNFKNIKYIPMEFANGLTRGKISNQDILIVKDGATTGKVAFVDENFPFHEAYINEHIFKCSLKTIAGYPKYFYWFLFSSLGKKEILQNFRGVAQGGIIRSFAENVHIPLPPLEEQKQILDKLDSFFSKAILAKNKLQKLPEILSALKRSIVNHSASGGLTANWRVNKDVPHWETVLLKDLIFDRPRNGYSPKPVNYETHTKSLALSATTSGTFDAGHYKYLDETIPSTSHLWLQDGDILIQRGNTIEYVGVSAIYRGAPNTFIYPDLMMKVTHNEKILPEFLYYCLSSDPIRKYFRNNATGVSGSMPKINQKVVSDAVIKLPRIEEQAEIVKRTELLLSLVNQVNQKYRHAMLQLENAESSVLVNAFTGTLTKKWRDKNSNLSPIELDKVKFYPSEAVRVQRIKRTTNKKDSYTMKPSEIISSLQALTKASIALSAQDLLIAQGYPNDATIEQIENFFIEIRSELLLGTIVRERIKDEDFFKASK